MSDEQLPAIPQGTETAAPGPEQAFPRYTPPHGIRSAAAYTWMHRKKSLALAALFILGIHEVSSYFIDRRPGLLAWYEDRSAAQYETIRQRALTTELPDFKAQVQELDTLVAQHTSHRLGRLPLVFSLYLDFVRDSSLNLGHVVSSPVTPTTVSHWRAFGTSQHDPYSSDTMSEKERILQYMGDRSRIQRDRFDTASRCLKGYLALDQRILDLQSDPKLPDAFKTWFKEGFYSSFYAPKGHRDVKFLQEETNLRPHNYRIDDEYSSVLGKFEANLEAALTFGKYRHAFEQFLAKSSDALRSESSHSVSAARQILKEVQSSRDPRSPSQVLVDLQNTGIVSYLDPYLHSSGR